MPGSTAFKALAVKKETAAMSVRRACLGPWVLRAYKAPRAPKGRKASLAPLGPKVPLESVAPSGPPVLRVRMVRMVPTAKRVSTVFPHWC